MSHTLNKVSNRERRNFAAKIKEIVLYTPELRIAKKKKKERKHISYVIIKKMYGRG